MPRQLLSWTTRLQPLQCVPHKLQWWSTHSPAPAVSYAALAPIVCVPHQHQWWSASVPRQQRATPRQLLQCTPHQPQLGSTSLRRQRGATHRQRPAPVTEKSSPAPVGSLQQSLRQFVEAQFGAQSVRSSMCRLSVCQLPMLSVKTSCQPAPAVVRSTQDQDHVAPLECGPSSGSQVRASTVFSTCPFRLAFSLSHVRNSPRRANCCAHLGRPMESWPGLIRATAPT